MAYAENEGFASSAGVGSGLRCLSESTQPKTFGSGTGTLERLTPVSYNTSTGKMALFRGTVNEVNTITANATPATAGTFTLTVNGQTTAAIDFDATAAEVQAALEALSNVAVGDVAAVATTGADLGDANAVVTLTWGGLLAGQNITISITTAGLTGNAHALATPTAGGDNEANGTHLIKGFVWPDPITLNASDDVLGQVCLKGRIHIDDIPLVTGAYGRLELEAALRSGVRELGFTIEGMENFI